MSTASTQPLTPGWTRHEEHEYLEELS